MKAVVCSIAKRVICPDNQQSLSVESIQAVFVSIREKSVKLLMRQYQEQNPAPDKKREQMKWVQYMNNMKAQAEEMVKFELIYD